AIGFGGAAEHQVAAVGMEASAIVALVPARDLSAGLTVHRLPAGAWLAPGFIDLQVNGGGDVLFNDDPTPEAIDTIARAHRRFGTTGLLPTLISDTPDKMRAAQAAVAAGTNPSVLGIHFEGPFLSPEKCGAHDPRMIRRPDTPDEAFLTRAREGVVLVTLAPEVLPPGFISALARAGI